MQTFGEQLRIYRRQCRDPQRGGLLTQERLGELLGRELGDAGYSGAAVSDWERDKSKIGEDDRLVLVSLIAVLHKCGGLEAPAEANELLRAGNYRDLDGAERRRVSRLWLAGQRKRRPLPVDQERRTQLILLDKVRNFWIEGVLNASTRVGGFLELAHRQLDDVVEDPWSDVISPTLYDSGEEANGVRTLDAFRRADRALLILGAPGSGKTITMLALARELSTIAAGNPDEPVPVILNLASWTEQRRPLLDWAVEELTAKYQIPRRLGRAWLEKDQLLLLLDGFDEIRSFHRARCAGAINAFRESHGLTAIVVCSRIEEYRATGVQLKLGGAVELQPLTAGQIKSYLTRAGPELDGLRRALQQETTLLEMARSPLVLNILSLAYEGRTEGAPGQLIPPSSEGHTVSQRHYLLDAYVAHMFRRRGVQTLYTQNQTKMWLSSLAHDMVQHGQAELLVGQLQPSWLPSRRWRWLYLLLAWLANGIFAGLVAWLFLLLLRRVVPWPNTLSAKTASALGLEAGAGEFLLIVAGNLLLALVAGFLHALSLERRFSRPEGEAVGRRSPYRRVVIIGLVVGSLAFLLLAAINLDILAFAWALVEAVLFMVIVRYVHGPGYATEIRTVEALRWSWPRAGKGLVYSQILGVIAEVVETLVFPPYNGVRRTVITFGAAGLLLGGLRGRGIETKVRPYQGIWLSLRNALVAAVSSGLLLGLLNWLLRDPATGLLAGLFMALVAAPLFGASNVTKHLLLRFLLRLSRDMPWRMAHFLDYAVRLTFLRRVGGGYIFMHHLLMEHFAAAEK